MAFYLYYRNKTNKIVNAFVLKGDEFMPEMKIYL